MDLNWIFTTIIINFRITAVFLTWVVQKIIDRDPGQIAVKSGNVAAVARLGPWPRTAPPPSAACIPRSSLVPPKRGRTSAERPNVGRAGNLTTRVTETIDGGLHPPPCSSGRDSPALVLVSIGMGMPAKLGRDHGMNASHQTLQTTNVWAFSTVESHCVWVFSRGECRIVVTHFYRPIRHNNLSNIRHGHADKNSRKVWVDNEDTDYWLTTTIISKVIFEIVTYKCQTSKSCSLYMIYFCIKKWETLCWFQHIKICRNQQSVSSIF